VTDRYRCVAAQKADGFPVTAACEAAGVSRTAFYDWAAQGTDPSPRELEEAYLLNEIIDLHELDDTYGRPRMTAELRRRGWSVNHKRVQRLMAEHGIAGYRPRKRRSTTKQDPGAPPIPDRLGRRFDPDAIDVAWVGDLTYIPTDEGWLYLATVLDLGSRRLIGYSMGDAHDSQLAISALEAAVTTRARPQMADTIFHHDRGSEYTSAAFRAAAKRLGLLQSASRTGSCLDNAVAESLFASLKVELVNRYRYRTRAQARAQIFAWITRYNARRLHSTLDYVPPTEWEARHALDHPDTTPVPSLIAA
jgi:putative transposase